MGEVLCFVFKNRDNESFPVLICSNTEKERNRNGTKEV